MVELHIQLELERGQDFTSQGQVGQFAPVVFQPIFIEGANLIAQRDRICAQASRASGQEDFVGVDRARGRFARGQRNDVEHGQELIDLFTADDQHWSSASLRRTLSGIKRGQKNVPLIVHACDSQPSASAAANADIVSRKSA